MVKCNNVCSDKRKTLYGVPQGSVLGPLLFALYINDISSSLVLCQIHQFADDTVIFFSSESHETLCSTLNKELKLIYFWLCTNKLKLNLTKSKCMIIGKTKSDKQNFISKFNIEMSNEKIEFVDKIKYLGFMLNSQLNLNDYFEYIIGKIGKKVGFLSRLRYKLSLNTKKIIFNTIIKPHFDYCGSLLYFGNKTYLDQLQVLQNKSMRTILNYTRYEPINNMLKSLSWLNVEQCFKYQLLIFIYKIEHGLQPSYLQDFLKRNNEIHNYYTRHQDNFYINPIKKNYTSFGLFDKGLSMYNLLPSEVRGGSLSKTKKILKKYLLNN